MSLAKKDEAISKIREKVTQIIEDGRVENDSDKRLRTKKSTPLQFIIDSRIQAGFLYSLTNKLEATQVDGVGHLIADSVTKALDATVEEYEIAYRDTNPSEREAAYFSGNITSGLAFLEQAEESYANVKWRIMLEQSLERVQKKLSVQENDVQNASGRFTRNSGTTPVQR